MKRLYIALALLATLLVGCTLYYFQLERTATQLAAQMDAIYDGYPQAQSVVQIERVYQQWTDAKTWMSMALAHAELEDIEQCFSRLREAAVVQADIEAVILLRQLSDLLEHLHKMQQPTWENVF